MHKVKIGVGTGGVAVALDLDVVGRAGWPAEWSWASDDALLYALGVGAGLGDPLAELAFTTENTTGVPQLVLPTFGVLIAQAGERPVLGDFDPALLVHAEQGVTLHRPLPVSGTAQVTSRVTGMYDKGSGALITLAADAVDAATGDALVSASSALFVRGEGGFGGDRGPRAQWAAPDREPDHEVRYRTRPEQALLYRLSGDRNPLHADPAFAARGGFPRPILHGLCTYGFTGRALLHELCGGDPARFHAMHGRFTAPVLPGDDLIVTVWGGGADPATGRAIGRFRTAKPDGTVVIDHGTCTYVPAG